MHRHLISSIILALFAIAIYSNSLRNGFVYDDSFTIVENLLIKDFKNLPLLFSPDYFSLSGEMSYRPVVTFSYSCDYAIFKLNPYGYHLTNALLHSANGVMLYILVTQLFLLSSGSKTAVSINKGGHDYSTNLPGYAPLLVSLIYIAHPVLTEAVNGISFREDLLVFLFYFVTLNLYIFLDSNLSVTNRRLLSNSLYFLSCVLYLLSLFSKEMAVTLPLVLYCYEWKSGKKLWSVFLNRRIAGYVAFTILYGLIRFYFFANPLDENLSLHVPPVMVRLYTVPWLLLSYVKLALFPFSLSLAYDIIPARSLLALSFMVPFIVIVSILSTAALLRKKDPLSYFGILFFLITLLPVSNIYPLANLMAERYLYLPMAGLCIVAGTNAFRLLIVSSHRYQTALYFLSGLLMVILALFSFSVMKMNEVWRDSHTLWAHTLQKKPWDSRAHNNLGVFYENSGQIEIAQQEFMKAIQLDPDYAAAHFNLGTIYLKSGNLTDAEREFMTTLKLYPNHFKAHYNLGRLYGTYGKVEEATREYQSALELNPYDPKTHNNLGNIYDDLGRTDEAITEYKLALRLSPDYATAHFNMGVAYLRKGLVESAKAEFAIALKINPDDPTAKQMLQTINHQP